jgi:hypothetical protein
MNNSTGCGTGAVPQPTSFSTTYACAFPGDLNNATLAAAAQQCCGATATLTSYGDNNCWQYCEVHGSGNYTAVRDCLTGLPEFDASCFQNGHASAATPSRSPTATLMKAMIFMMMTGSVFGLMA